MSVSSSLASPLTCPLLRGAILVALTVCGAEAAALPVHVALDWPSGEPASKLTRVRIHAVRTGGTTERAVPVVVEAGREGVLLDLGDGIWQVQASAVGYWSPEAEVAVGGTAPASMRLALWPSASLGGEIRTAGGDPLPRDLTARLTAVPASVGVTTALRTPAPRPELSPSRAELRCGIEDGTWSCVGPAGLFDVQLEAEGYAPRYAWDLSLKATATTDLGLTILRREPSVFGRAVRFDGSNPEGPCRASLRAEVATRGSLPVDPGTPDDERTVSIALNSRGYFHAVGLRPGPHVLSVECPAASAHHAVHVRANGETRIDPPLRLEELTLDVVVTPGVDPEGRPWRLTVDATAPRQRRIADKSAASTDGRWAGKGLTAGSYRVALQSASGTPWLQRFFELRPESGPLSLSAASMRVAGRVRLGTQPLRARLVFFNEAGGEPVTVSSDDTGGFQGLFPVASSVSGTRWTVEAHAAKPPINRRLEGVRVDSVAGEATAHVDLALPIVAVRGTVVSEASEPQIGAQVSFEDASSGLRTVTATDEAGSFELLELPPGRYTAAAESVEGASERTTLDVAEGVESELSLVLGRSERVALSVVGTDGPVAGAAVQIWLAPGVPRTFTRTDPDGRFELDLPPGTDEVGLTVGAPGHALKLARLPVSSEQTLTLGASRGTLVLDLQRPGHAPDGATPYLVHDGAIEAAGALAGWGTAAAGVSVAQPVIDAIEPGVYSLCLAEPEEVAALWRGALPKDRCRTGSVEPGRTLILSPP